MLAIFFELHKLWRYTSPKPPIFEESGAHFEKRSPGSWPRARNWKKIHGPAKKREMALVKILIINPWKTKSKQIRKKLMENW